MKAYLDSLAWDEIACDAGDPVENLVARALRWKYRRSFNVMLMRVGCLWDEVNEEDIGQNFLISPDAALILDSFDPRRNGPLTRRQILARRALAGVSEHHPLPNEEPDSFLPALPSVARGAAPWSRSRAAVAGSRERSPP